MVPCLVEGLYISLYSRKSCKILLVVIRALYWRTIKPPTIMQYSEMIKLYSFIRHKWWRDGVDKSWQRLMRVAPIVAHWLWSRWTTNTSIAFWLNKCAAMRVTSFGNSLLKEVTLALKNIFQWHSASLINLLAYHWNLLVAFGSFEEWSSVVYLALMEWSCF
jgi:hypothetical protein